MAMVLATAAWMTWWVAIVVHRFAPAYAPNWRWVYGLAGIFAAAGLGLGLFTIRARTIWLLLASVPIVANASLLLVPALLHEDVVRALARPQAEPAPLGNDGLGEVEHDGASDGGQDR
ncbi:MAG: hypothetical protein ACI8QC_003502 [Planctomycetota bacterium]|jgi:hypothetical protein